MNNIESICNIIRDRVGDRVTEEALHLSVSLESSVKEFVESHAIWESEPMTDQEMADEYLENNAEYQQDLEAE